MNRLMFWIWKGLKSSRRNCRCFCMTCPYYDKCSRDGERPKGLSGLSETGIYRRLSLYKRGKSSIILPVYERSKANFTDECKRGIIWQILSLR